MTDAPPERRGRILRLLAGLLLTLAVLGTGAYGGFRWAVAQYEAPGPLAEERAVVIPRGAATGTIAERLLAAGVIANARAFLIAAWATADAGPLRAGEYAFPERASLGTVLEVLRSGRTVQRRLTVPEGLTVAQILALLDETEGLTGSVETPPPEGSLLPETWSYSWGDTRESLVRRMREAMDRALAEAWAERAEDLPIATPREALILASIIERETGIAEERGKVAGVFINRLRRGMPLQSDPTVIYAVTDGAGAMDRPLSRADLDTDHPHNTYRNRGLPPTPIASPGRASLLAAVRPEETNALYFVADGRGGHVFSRTLEEHNRAVARLRAIERERRSTN